MRRKPKSAAKTKAEGWNMYGRQGDSIHFFREYATRPVCNQFSMALNRRNPENFSQAFMSHINARAIFMLCHPCRKILA